jgi:hypothetical protein
MVIDDLEVVDISIREAKTQTPLFVHPNAELPWRSPLRVSNRFAGGMRRSSMRRALSSI